MCRIMICTDSAMAEGMRQLLYLRLIDFATIDGEQHDGSGVTDGTMMYKTSAPSFAVPVAEITDCLNDGHPWLYHVRKKSPKTEGSSAAAHPFILPVDKKKLAAVHNGFFQASEEMLADYIKKTGQEQNAEMQNLIASDSLRAFTILSHIIASRGAKMINAAIVEEWLSHLREDSAYAVAVLQGSSVWATRNEHRTLWAGTFGNGMMVCTSRWAIDRFNDWARFFYGAGSTIMKPTELSTKKLYEFRLGEDKPVITDLKLNMRKPPVENDKPISVVM